MKTNKLLSSLLAVFAGIVLFAPGYALAAAFGVSPPLIENENLKPGSNFTYVINLSANGLSEDMTVYTEFDGDPEIARWVTVVNKDDLVMTTGQSMVPMSVNVNVPADAKVGEYKGNLSISIAPESSHANEVAVLLGGNAKIRLGVVNYDVTDYWVQTISADSIVEGQAVDLKMSIKNLGNTIINNVKTNISLTDIKTRAKVASGSADSLNISIQPQTMADAVLPILIPNLKAGNYWLDIEALKDGKSTYENRLHFTVEPSTVNNALTTVVEVVEEGTVRPVASEEVKQQLSPKTSVQTSVTVRAPLTNKLIGAIIVLLIVLTGIVIKIYVTFKKKHR
ncbi:hypothetical protein KJ657_01580 [Patescibacteria group bacterium]|nr:hypothetical protein [Patescibacteria group bacterium]